MLNTIAAVVRTVRRMVLRPVPWVESQLISRDGQMIYTVRDSPGKERQVRHAWRNEWKPVSKAKFSTLPCFEDWHRMMFQSSIPYSQNARALAEERSDDSQQRVVGRKVTDDPVDD
jgi:hypothetical protein